MATTFQERAKRLTTPRIILGVVGMLLIVISWYSVISAQRGLTSLSITGTAGVPLRYIAPSNATDIPGVVIAHGFAGSKQLMLGYATVLAHAGYGVMLLDFDGHGTSRGRLDRQGDGLKRNLDAAYEALLSQPGIDPDRVALLGHSMGSGAVMRAGVEDADRYRATIAVSPTGADVTPERPRNFLLQAGFLEPQFADNARELLAAAGGENDALAEGRGRKLVIVPGVEHITILFSQGSHQAALDWLNETFNLPPASAAPDRRMIWYGAHLAGWLLFLFAVVPLLAIDLPSVTSIRRSPWHWVGLVIGTAVAIFGVTLLGRLLNTSSLGGLLVGGVLGLWFLFLGLIWLLLGFRIPKLSTSDLIWGLALFVFLTLAFGVMAQSVWLPWWLNTDRLLRWPFLAAASLPWLLAAGLLQHRLSISQRAGWWLVETVVIVAGLGLTVLLNPGLFFVVLLMPVIPIILGIMAIAGAIFDRPWSYAIGNALFFGWLLVAVFPLA